MKCVTPGKQKPQGPYLKSTVLLFIVLLLSAFSASVFAEVLAQVNQTEIYDHQVEGHVRSYLKQIGHDRLSPLRMVALKKEVLKKLIEEELLYQEGIAAGLTVSEQEVAAGVEKIRQRFASRDAYDEALSKEALSVEDIKIGVSRSILIQKAWQRLSQMNEAERTSRLREMTRQADIRIFEARVPASAEHE